jgi:hypothetical protein
VRVEKARRGGERKAKEDSEKVKGERARDIEN